jgi:hypothetical protein
VRDGPQAVCEGSGSGIQSPHRAYRHRKEDGDYVVLDLMAGFDEFEHGDVIEGDLESSSIYEYPSRSKRPFLSCVLAGRWRPKLGPRSAQGLNRACHPEATRVGLFDIRKSFGLRGALTGHLG